MSPCVIVRGTVFFLCKGKNLCIWGKKKQLFFKLKRKIKDIEVFLVLLKIKIKVRNIVKNYKSAICFLKPVISIKKVSELEKMLCSYNFLAQNLLIMMTFCCVCVSRLVS